MIVLKEGSIYAKFSISPLAVGFGKEPAVITKTARLNDQYPSKSVF